MLKVLHFLYTARVQHRKINTMTPFTEKYLPATPADIVRLVQEYPLAWIASHGTKPQFTALPLYPVLNADGVIVGLRGHYARANPQVETLRAAPTVQILFMGPQGYISPSVLTDRTQAPSWNYASVIFEAEATIIDDEQAVKGLMHEQISTLETGKSPPWQLEDMGERYEKLARWICGIDARITACHPRFKLSQDDRDDVYGELCKNFATENPALRVWMQRTNPSRTTK